MSVAAAVAVRANAEVQRMIRAVAPETNGRAEVAQSNNNSPATTQTAASLQQNASQAVARVMPGAVTALASSGKPGQAKLTYSRAMLREKERSQREEPREKEQEQPGEGVAVRGLAAYRRNG